MSRRQSRHHLRNRPSGLSCSAKPYCCRTLDESSKGQKHRDGYLYLQEEGGNRLDSKAPPLCMFAQSIFLLVVLVFVNRLVISAIPAAENSYQSDSVCFSYFLYTIHRLLARHCLTQDQRDVFLHHIVLNTHNHARYCTTLLSCKCDGIWVKFDGS